MTFKTPQEAEEACVEFRAVHDEALEAMQESFEQLEAARDQLESERSFWDGSTFGSGAAVGGALATCIQPAQPVCWFGLIAGGAGVLGSELDRRSDIEAAEDAVAQAELLYDLAVSRYQDASSAYAGCLIHHVSKGG